MIHIHTSKNLPIPVEIQRLEKAVLKTLIATSTPVESEITLVLTDDRKLHQLNRDFLGIDAPTDVLSFPADFTDPDSQEKYLGDILISVPRAVEQARESQGSIEAELILLTVHGTLHLLGYDHATETDKEKMWAVQSQIVGELT